MSIGRFALGAGVLLGLWVLIASGPAQAAPPPPKKEPKKDEEDPDVINLDARRHSEDESEGSGSSIRAATKTASPVEA